MTKSIGILGGGFGTYGYMPAAVDNQYQVCTLLRYSEIIKDRTPLRDYHSKINYLETEQEVLENCNYLVIARDPLRQHQFIRQNVEILKSKMHLFLEKPLADTPINAAATLDTIRRASISFSVGYLFTYCSWYSDIICRDASSKESFFKITWKIPRPPDASWKSTKSQGGGIFQFYCIHFIKFALDLGVSVQEIDVKPRENCLSMHFRSNNNFYSIDVFLTENAPQFVASIKQDKKTKVFYDNATPFGPHTSKFVKDPRIPYLRSYLHSRVDHKENSKVEIEIEEAAIYLFNKFL